jgi:Co/Zn/Cd efflux system component
MNQKSQFKINKMDCPSEENLIRMKLADYSQILSLDFDLQNRVLKILHKGETTSIQKALDELKMDTHLISTESSTETIQSKTSDKSLLWAVLWINLAFFFIEGIGGWIYASMGLVADGLDMLADVFVYGLAIYALQATRAKKNIVAKLSGYLQIALACFGLFEVIERFRSESGIPEFRVMIIVSFFALLANSLSLMLLRKSDSKDTPIQASLIFTSNDVIANIGVILAGILVYFTQSKIPDLVIGMIVFGFVARGAFRILSLTKKATKT